MKNKIGSIIVCLISLIYIGLSSYTNIFSDLGIEYGARLFTIIIIDIYLLMILFEGTSNAFGKDKLFDIIVNNTDTVYLIMNKDYNQIHETDIKVILNESLPPTIYPEKNYPFFQFH